MNELTLSLPASPQEKLSRLELTTIQQNERDLHRKNDAAVADELRKAVQQEATTVSVDYIDAVNCAYKIVEHIYGLVHYSIVPKRDLGVIVKSCRDIFDKLYQGRFPETTFLYMLVALELVRDDTCLPYGDSGLPRRLANQIRYVAHKQRGRLLEQYRDSMAINVIDPSGWIHSPRFDANLVREVLCTNISGPSKARALRRFWPDVMRWGLLAGDKFIEGASLSVGFLTFGDVESFFTHQPELCVLGYLKGLADSQTAGSQPQQAGRGLDSIDRHWGRSQDPVPPKPLIPQYPGKVTPIDLTQPDSCRLYLTESQFSTFLSPDASPSAKATILKILWSKIPDVGLVVAYIAHSMCPSVVIDKAFISFPQGDLRSLEQFFERMYHWRAYDFANLLGFCLRQKQLVFQGRAGGCCDPSEEFNYRTASRVRTVGQAVKHFKKIHSAWEDEGRIYTPQ